MGTITARGVTKTYEQGDTVIFALNDADLDVNDGEFVTIVGKSGSGKSTLLNIIGCIDEPSLGSVKIDGTEIVGASSDELAKIRRQKIGYIFQSFNLLPILTARENIIMPLLLDNKPLDKAYFNELITLIGLQDRLKHLPSELSGGQRQRVAIARALINRPSIILADEPTGNLDKKSADEIMGLLIEIGKRGSTVLLVTHNEEYAKLSDKKVVIDNGELSVAG